MALTVSPSVAAVGQLVSITGAGGAALKSVGGTLTSAVVTGAGSAGDELVLYSGTDTSGQPIFSGSLAAVGPMSTPNSSFSALYAEVTGSGSAVVRVAYQ